MLREVEFLKLLPETWREVVEVHGGTLRRCFGASKAFQKFRSNDCISQSGRRWMSSTRRAPIALCIVTSKKVVKHMTRIG
jgi:hypothetical protein